MMMMMKWTQNVKKMNSGREAVENRRRLSMGYVEMSHPSSNWKIGIQKTPLNHTGKKTNVEQRANEKKTTEWTTPAAIATNEFSHYFLSSCVVHRARCCFFCLFQAFIPFSQPVLFVLVLFQFHLIQIPLGDSRRLYRMKTMIHCISTRVENGNASECRNHSPRHKSGSENEERTNRKEWRKNPNTNAVDTYYTAGNEVEERKKNSLARSYNQPKKARTHTHAIFGNEE